MNEATQRGTLVHAPARSGGGDAVSSAFEARLFVPRAALITPRYGHRARRVIILLIGILLLSVADLAVTLANLHSVGMVEANPLARMIIERTGSSLALVAFKMTTVFICIGLLFRLRFHVQGEIASWLGLLILVGLSLYWGHYTRQMNHSEVITQRANDELPDDRWLTLVP